MRNGGDGYGQLVGMWGATVGYLNVLYRHCPRTQVV